MRQAIKSLLKIAFVLLLIVALVGAYIVQQYRLYLATPFPVGQLPLYINIPSGSQYRDLVEQLIEKKLIKNSLYLDWHVRLNSLSGRIQAGRYVFDQSPTPKQLMQQLVAGKVELHRISVIEGWRFSQLIDALHRHPNIKRQLISLKPLQIMEQLGYQRRAPEGLFYPDTYFFPDQQSDIDFLIRAYEAMQAVLQSAWENRADHTEVNTPYEALIMASIVEKETALPSERDRIAGVFNRRLTIGMRLQSDPTVIYGMANYQGNIRRKDLMTDTPYNTYTRSGLPPTPIALPGKAAIEAVLHPRKGDSLYFVAKGDGSHQFSATLKAHNKAVFKYQIKPKRTKKKR